MAERPEEVKDHQTQDAEPTPAASEELKAGDEVAQRRAEIEQTRAEMGETIDALQQKLDPQKLKEQARRQASGVGSELLGALKNNPAPVAIAGAALLSLLLIGPLLRERGSSELVVDLRSREIRRA